MSNVVAYDDRQLAQMLDELSEKNQRKALKGGIRRAVGKVRRAALANLSASGLRSDADVRRGVRARVFKSLAGGEVTIKARKRGSLGMHLNRYGQLKPVLMWAEGGTKSRRKRGGSATGKMPRYGFMAKTEAEAAGIASGDMVSDVRSNIVKVVSKHGGHQ